MLGFVDSVEWFENVNIGVFVMGQRWIRLSLIVVLLLWKNADGFKGVAYSNERWDQPSDTFSPLVVQSSMSEAHVTGTLPEEVGSNLFPNKPLKSRSKLNLLQFVKGGSSSYQSMPHAQTVPSSYASASLPLPPVQKPSSSLMSSGSAIPGVASGLHLETQYAASGSGSLVSMQGGSSSYPAKLGISGQSTSDGLHVSSSQETSVHQSAEAPLPVFSSISYSSSSAPGAASTSPSSPVLLSESSGQPVSSRGEGSYSGLSRGASSPYTSVSSTKLSSSTISHQSSGGQSSPSWYSSRSQDSSGAPLASGSFLKKVTGLSPLETSSQLLPLVSSQSISGQRSPSLHVASPQISSDSKSTYAAASPYTWGTVPYSSLSSQAQGSATSQGSSGAELSASSVQSIPTQVGSDGSSGVSQSLTASSPYTPGSLSNKLDALPLWVSSQSTNAQSSPIVSMSNTQSRSGTQLATYHYDPVQGGSSSKLYLKPLGTPGQYTPMSPTKYIKGPTSSRTTYRAVSQVGSRSQMEASGPFLSPGGNYYTGLLPQSQATSGRYALGYSKPISSPQSTSSQSASVLSSHKQSISASQGSSGAQFGASQGMSSSFSGSIQSQGPLSLLCKCALSPLDVDSQTTPSSHKHLTSSYGTQAESSTPFTLQGSVTYDGSPQPKVAASQFAPVSHSYPSVSSQGVASRSTTVRDSQKQLTSTYTGSSGTQAGSSTPFTLHRTAYGGSPQHTASQFSPGLPSSYPGLSLSSPLGVASQSSSWKQFTSASQGSSAAPFGSSTGFAPEGMSNLYSGSVQSQDTASQFAPGSKPSYTSLSVSSPQAVAGPTTLQSSRKQFTSTFTGSSGTQAGSSTPFTLHRTAYGGSSPPRDTASHFPPGSLSSYPGFLSSPLGVASQSSSRKQFTSASQGSSGTQAGSSFTLQGSTAYGGSSPQDAASQFVPGSSSPYASVSLPSPQGVSSQSNKAYQRYSVSQSQKSQRWQPLAAHWTQGIQTSDAAASQGSSSPMHSSSLSSAGGFSRVSSPLVSARGGSTSYDGSFQSQSLSTKYTPGSQLLPYDPSVAGQSTSSASASEVLSSYSSVNNQNAPAPSRSSLRRFYSIKG